MDHEEEIRNLKLLSTKEMEDLDHFLTTKMTHSRKGLCISIRKYVICYLEETSMLEFKPSNISIDSNCNSSKEKIFVNKEIPISSLYIPFVYLYLYSYVSLSYSSLL